MRYYFLSYLFISVLLVWTTSSVVSAADDNGGKCAENAVMYECPSFTETCGETITVKDCLDCPGNLSTDVPDRLCFDRKLLNGKANPNPGYLWRDVAGIIVWFIAAGVATACGVGGGGIYVPLGIILMAFAPKQSSGLSQASIFGASLGGLILNVRNHHPFATKVESPQQPPPEEESALNATTSRTRGDHLTSVPCLGGELENTDTVRYYTRPLIDFDMALFLAPMEMAGAVLGVLIQKILPNWLYLFLAAIILGYTAYKTYTKYKETHNKEEKEKQEAALEATHEETRTLTTDMALPEGPLSTNNKDEEAIEKSVELSADQNNNNDDGLDCGVPGNMTASESTEEVLEVDILDPEKIALRNHMLERDSRQYPKEKFFALLILWVGLIILTFLKGGKGVDSLVGITCASPWYGVLIAIQFAWTLGFASLFGYRLMHKENKRISVGYHFHPHDVHWGLSEVRFYAFFTFIAGIVAGLIGIGGGMVLGPLMLIMGIHPRVSTATTATMLVLTSSSVAVLFVTAGMIPWQYAVTFFSVCFCGALLGKMKIDGYVKRTGKASLLIFLLAIIIGLATLGCLVIVLMRLSAANWCFAGFNQFCSLPADDGDGDVCATGNAQRMLFGFPSEL